MPVPEAVQVTLSAMLIGLVVGALLLGVNLLQTFLYFRNFSQDRWSLKILVAFVCLLDIAHTTCLMQAAYHYTVIGFGDFTELQYGINTFNTANVLTGLVAYLSRAFFSHRVYMVTKSKIVGIFCAFIATVQFGFGLAAAAQAFALHSFIVFGAIIRWTVVVFTSLGIFGDLFNATTLCIALSRNRCGVARTDKVVDRIIAYTMGTGLITSLVEISVLICYVTMRNFIYLAQLTLTAKLFSNSLLASLNARASLRDEMEQGKAFSTFKVKPFSVRAPASDGVDTVSSGNGQSDVEPEMKLKIEESKIGV